METPKLEPPLKYGEKILTFSLSGFQMDIAKVPGKLTTSICVSPDKTHGDHVTSSL